VVAGAPAKLYLTDPLLASLPSRLRTGLPEPDITRLTEMTIGVALARAIDDLEEGRWVTGDTSASRSTRYSDCRQDVVRARHSPCLGVTCIAVAGRPRNG
jgi:hypothetical protein